MNITQQQNLDGYIQILLKKVHEHPGVELDVIKRAIEFGKAAHKGQMRASGECYYVHPVRVAIKATDYAVDSKTIIGALLHDVVEDTPFTKDQVEQEFGKTVSDLVEALTKVKTDKELSLKKIFRLGNRDFRVILIKLLDRLDNLSDLQNLKRPKQIRISEETVAIYAEVAHGLGLIEIEEELRDLAFQIRYPKVFKRIKNQIQTLYGERKSAIEQISGLLKEAIPRELTSGFFIQYFKPHDFQKTDIEVDHILESITFRAGNIASCYEILGKLHTRFRCIPLTFRDYISNPKANGWRGLETKLLINGEKIPIFLVTEEFHEKNRKGVITLIKDETYHDADYSQFLSLYLDLELNSGAMRIEDIFRMDKTKKIQVMTPKGDVLEMRYGATILDFAFQIHTDVGLHCVGGIINDARYPREKILEDGMIIKVLTKDTVHPELDWLDFIVMPKARKEIIRYCKLS